MFTIPIDIEKKEPIYEQIYTYIREEIKSGALTSGAKLPSGRSMAGYLNVSRNTVDMAYGQLLSEGYIESKARSGYYVSEIGDWMALSFLPENKKEKKEASEKKWLVDFSPDGVDMEYFPYNRWRKLMKEALIVDNRELFQAGDPRGDLALRRAILQYLHQSRGVKCQEEQIVVGAGLDYLLLLLCQMLGRGRRIAMEEATYKQAYRIFCQMDYEVLPIRMDSQGICLGPLKDSGAEFAYVMPSHQFPTGAVMSINRRHGLLSWAVEQEGRYIIEDDYDSEFRYQGKPIPSLQSGDPMGKVIYAGTFSKAIAPAIRVGYLVLPWKLLPAFWENAGFYSCSVSRIDQAVLAHFLKDGYFERHLNKMRGIYRAKHDFFLKELKRLPGLTGISGQSTGLHVMLHFPNHISENRLARLARDKGIRVYPAGECRIGEEKEGAALILGFARLNEGEIQKGISALIEAWEPVFAKCPANGGASK